MKIARRLFALALRLYPAGFRDRFAAEMEADYLDRLDAIRDGRGPAAGRLPMARFTARTLASLVLNAGLERCRPTSRSRPRGTENTGEAPLMRFLTDLRYAGRLVRRQPAFSAVVILTLGVAVGANTAIFSLVDGVLLRDMAYPDPDRLVTVWSSNLGRGVDRWGVSLHDYEDWRGRSDAFADLGVWNQNTINLSGTERPERIAYAQVSPSLFTTLGTEPVTGRLFTEEEMLPGNDAVVIVSHAFWRNRLGGGSDAIGRTVRLDGRTMSVVGVMPESFGFPSRAVELWKPFGMHAEDEGSRAGRWVRAVGRLRDDLEMGQASVGLSALGRELAEDFPETNTGFGIYIEPLLVTSVGQTRQTLLILWGMAGLVLLMAAANIANLLLARAGQRERELAVRAALGAGRARVIGQLVAEGLPLALGACAVGLGVAYGGLSVLETWSQGRIPRLEEASLSGSVLLYSLAVTIAVAVSFSLVPALRSTRIQLVPALKEGGRGLARRSGARLRSGLFVGEVVLAMSVLTASALLLRSFIEISAIDPGFEARNALTVRIAPSRLEIPERVAVAAMFDEIQASVASMPSVESVTAVNAAPFSGNAWGATFEVEGREFAPGEGPSGLMRVVLPGYHETLGIPVVRGRTISRNDASGAIDVVVLSEALAEDMWPGENPIGRRIGGFAEPGRWYTVIGVVGDIVPALGASPRGMAYVPFRQGRFGHFQDWGMTFVIRTSGAPGVIAPRVREAVAVIAPDLPAFAVSTLEELGGANVAARRLVMQLFAIFAAIALILATSGVYSVMAYLVSERTKDIGVRRALGAARGNILGLVVRQGMSLALVGVALGLGVSAATSQLLDTMLYETSPTEPLTYALVSAVVALAALAATLVPAGRALKVDPLTTLRAE